jgi:hypothetical protein
VKNLDLKVDAQKLRLGSLGFLGWEEHVVLFLKHSRAWLFENQTKMRQNLAPPHVNCSRSADGIKLPIGEHVELDWKID